MLSKPPSSSLPLLSLYCCWQTQRYHSWLRFTSDHGKAVSDEVYKKGMQRIQYGGDEVVQVKDGAGSAILLMAYAGARFTNELLRGLNCEKDVVTPIPIPFPLTSS